MGIGNILGLSQVTGYVLSIILSFFVCWPMSVCLINFNGRCILYSSGQYVDTGAPEKVFRVTFWANGTSCAFTIFLSFAVLVVSIWQIIRLSVHLLKNTDSSFIGVFLTCVSNLLVFVLILGTALGVTFGLKVWCDSIVNKRDVSCSIAAIGAKWEDPKIQPDGFFTTIAIVEFGLYSLLITWFVENVFSAYKLLGYHRQEHLLRSLSRERQRLLGDYNPEF